MWLDEWAIIYPAESESKKQLEKIYNDVFLVNVVDNDYIEGNLYEVFDKFFEQEKALIESL